MVSGQGGVVCELREDEAEPEMGSAQAEEVGNGGSTVSFELAGVRVDGGGILGFRGGEPERERVESNVGVFLVLLHARGGEPGHCPSLATAAARWRPSGSRVCVAETGKLQREGKRAARSSGTTCGCHGEQEVACGPPRRRVAPLSAGGRASRGAGR